MKYLFLVIVFFISTSYTSNRSVIISEELEPYVQQFIIDADNHGVDGFNIVFNLHGIYKATLTKHIDSTFRGMYYDNEVYIDTINFVNSVNIKTCLYHEIMHSIGKEHDTINKNSIMFPYRKLDEEVILYSNDSIWNAELNNLFKK